MTTTEKQQGMVAHLLSHMKREQLGVPTVMRDGCDYSGSVLDTVIAKSDRWMVSELIEKLMDGQDEAALTILNQLGYFDALDAANVEAELNLKNSFFSTQSA